MTWTRLPDDFTDRPAFLRLSRSARLLHVEALVWCNRLLTNGELPTHVLRRVTDSDDVDRDVADLAEAGLWMRMDDATWQVDWSDQEKAEVVEQRREDNAARQRRYNERQRRHARGDHSMCHPSHCPALRRNTSGDASGNTSDDADPTRPDPSRPKGRDGSEVREGGSATSDGSPGLAASSASPPPPDHEAWAAPSDLPPGVTPTVVVRDQSNGSKK